MVRKNIFKISVAFVLGHFNFCNSSNALWADIKATHVTLSKIDDKYNKGDISLKKAEEKKYPLWKKLAQDYSSLTSINYYYSKSSVGVSVPSGFTTMSLIVPNNPKVSSSTQDIPLPAQDIAAITAALKSGAVLDVRLFFDEYKKMLFYVVVNIGTNLNVASGSFSINLTVAPTNWYLIIFQDRKQIPSGWQAWNDSIYLEMA